MQELLIVFAFNKHSDYSICTPDSCHRGWFDGETFIARKIGYCESFEELSKYDFFQFMGPNGVQKHISKESLKYKNLLEHMKESYCEVFGRNQQIRFLNL